MNIIRQGYYQEMPHGEPTDPSIKESVGKEHSQAMIEKICAYLDSGIPVVVCAGVVTDILHPERGPAGSPTSMTDGRWMWPGDLSYYVRNYKLKISDEFIETMEQNNWRVPITADEIDYETLTIDGQPLFQE